MKRVLCIHDLCGFGRCSLGVAVPILSVMGIQCLTLPTAFFSVPTNYPSFTHRDLTDILPQTLAQYAALGVQIDAIYSGFVSSAAEIALVAEARRLFPDAQLIVDPVMGDDGKIYKTYTDNLCAAMAALALDADVITPNVTEAAILLGRSPVDAPRTLDDAAAWLHALRRGHRAVVLTGVETAPDVIATIWSDTAGSIGWVKQPRIVDQLSIGGTFPGTGDVFASVLVGNLVRGKSLGKSVKAAAEFVRRSAAATVAAAADPEEGVLFEDQLGTLTIDRHHDEGVCPNKPI